MLHLDLGRRFDAAFAMNCLLHVSPEYLPAALERIACVLAPGGLFYRGQCGGFSHAGPFPDDAYEPRRYFSWLTDDQLLGVLSETFEIVSSASWA